MRKTVVTLVLLFAAASAYSQNLNPQVQVTNDYQSTAPDIRKQDIPVSIPDSVLHFDYTFDYSVFDSPYKGAYEFTPYVIGYTPDKSLYDGHTLYVRAGAGYGLYPQLDAVYSPAPAGNYSMSVVQNLSGYYGDYWKVAPNLQDPMDLGVFEIPQPGYNLQEKFAVEGRWGRKKARIGWKADYDGIFFKDWMQHGNYHSAGLKLGAKSNINSSKAFFYDVNLQGRFASDIVSHPFSTPSLYETDARLFGSVGPVLDRIYRVLVDYDLRYNRMDGSFDGRSIAEYSVTPHVALSAGIFSIDAGARLDYVGGRVSAAPDLLVYADALKGSVRFFAGAGGGQHALTYSDFKQRIHFFTPAYTEDFQNVVREKITAFAGFKGHIGPRFNYEARAGYAAVTGAPMETVALQTAGVLPGIAFRDFNVLGADLSFSWDSRSFLMDGKVSYRKTTLAGKADAFDLPAISGNARAVYNYRSRIYAGVSLECQTARRAVIAASQALTVPMWMDLGAYAEYFVGQRFSVWVRGGNLLNYFVRRDPFHIERGINGTAGISLLL